MHGTTPASCIPDEIGELAPVEMEAIVATALILYRSVMPPGFHPLGWTAPRHLVPRFAVEVNRSRP